jgi:hypothetical protein
LAEFGGETKGGNQMTIPSTRASREMVEEWAASKLESIDEELIVALHIMGWKIVPQGLGSGSGVTVNPDGSFPKWPFNRESVEFVCPDWCEDMK